MDCNTVSALLVCEQKRFVEILCDTNGKFNCEVLLIQGLTSILVFMYLDATICRIIHQNCVVRGVLYDNEKYYKENTIMEKIKKEISLRNE